MTSGRAIWINVQAVTMVFVSLVLFAGVVHVTNGDLGQAFENTIVAASLAGAVLLGRFVERRVVAHQRVEGLRRRFDADVAAELAEAEKWHAEKLYEERQAAALAERVRRWEAHLPGVEEAEELAYAEKADRANPQFMVDQMQERRRQARSRSERGFGRYLDPKTAGDVHPERIQAAAQKHFSIVADQLGINYSTLAQHQRDLILRPLPGVGVAMTGNPFPYDVVDTSTTESWGVLEPVRVDPTTGELGLQG